MLTDNNGSDIFNKIKSAKDTSDLILGLEKFDTITNSNFPNGTSTSYYLKETGRFSHPMTLIRDEWFSMTQSLVNNGNNHQFNNYAKRFNGYVNYQEISQIPDNSKYIYHINMITSDYFELNRNIGFKVVNPRVLKDVNSDNAAIVITHIYEAYSGSGGLGENDFEILNNWIIEAKLNPKNVWYLTGNLIAHEKYKDVYPYNIVSVTSQELWNDAFAHCKQELTFSPSNEKFLFLSFNRQPRLHRILLLAELMHHELFDYGKISFNLMRGNCTGYIKNYNPDYENYGIKLTEMGKQIIDIDNDPNLACNVNTSLMEQTFVSLVTETHVHPGTLQFSEKVWKPLMSGHPFILLASNHALKCLKNIGFKTYSDWFDESYDDADLQTKLKIICQNLLRYKNCSVEELKVIREQMKEVARYNQQRMEEYVTEKYLTFPGDLYNRHGEKIIIDWFYSIQKSLQN